MYTWLSSPTNFTRIIVQQNLMFVNVIFIFAFMSSEIFLFDKSYLALLTVQKPD